MKNYRKYIIFFLLGIIAFYFINKSKNIEGLDNQRGIDELISHSGLEIPNVTEVNSNTVNGPIRMTIKGNFRDGHIIDEEDDPDSITQSFTVQSVLHNLLDFINKNYIQTTKGNDNSIGENGLSTEIRGVEEIYENTTSIDFVIKGIAKQKDIPEILRGNELYNNHIPKVTLQFMNGYYILPVEGSTGQGIRIDYGLSGYVYKWESLKFSQISVGQDNQMIATSDDEKYCNKYSASGTNNGDGEIGETNYEIEDLEDCNNLNYTLNLRTYDTTKMVVAPCRDSNQYCHEWVTEDLCQISEYMQNNCKRSCGLCEELETPEILPPDVTHLMKLDHDREINMNWSDLRYLSEDSYDNFSSFTNNNYTGSGIQQIDGVNRGQRCKLGDDGSYLEEVFTQDEMSGYDELKENCREQCYTQLNSCRGFSIHSNTDNGPYKCRFYQNCHEGERELINDNEIRMGNPEGDKFDYYFKPPLDPLMGDSLEVSLIADEARLTPDELRQQRISPARYSSFNLSPGSANTFTKFDEEKQLRLNTMTFDRNNMPFALDTKTNITYKCSPGTRVTDGNKELCINPADELNIIENQSAISSDIRPQQIENIHSSRNSTFFYGLDKETGVSKLVQKNPNSSVTNIDEIDNILDDSNNGISTLGNLSSYIDCYDGDQDSRITHLTDEFLFSPISNYVVVTNTDRKLINSANTGQTTIGEDAMNFSCSDDSMTDEYPASNVTFDTCKQKCTNAGNLCKAFSYHDYNSSSEVNNCRIYKSDCSDMSNSLIEIVDGNPIVNKEFVFNPDDPDSASRPLFTDILQYLFPNDQNQLTNLQNSLIGVYNCDNVENLSEGKWKDLSGIGNDATINNPLGVRMNKVGNSPYFNVPRSLGFDEVINTGNMRPLMKVIQGFSDSMGKEYPGDISSIDFPQTLNGNNYTIFYITRYAPDYDQSDISIDGGAQVNDNGIRINKPWATAYVQNQTKGDNEKTQDIGFSKNKGRVMTSRDKDWLSGHYGGAPECVPNTAGGHVTTAGLNAIKREETTVYEGAFGKILASPAFDAWVNITATVDGNLVGAGNSGDILASGLLARAQQATQGQNVDMDSTAERPGAQEENDNERTKVEDVIGLPCNQAYGIVGSEKIKDLKTGSHDDFPDSKGVCSRADQGCQTTPGQGQYVPNNPSDGNPYMDITSGATYNYKDFGGNFIPASSAMSCGYAAGEFGEWVVAAVGDGNHNSCHDHGSTSVLPIGPYEKDYSLGSSRKFCKDITSCRVDESVRENIDIKTGVSCRGPTCKSKNNNNWLHHNDNNDSYILQDNPVSRSNTISNASDPEYKKKLTKFILGCDVGSQTKENNKAIFPGNHIVSAAGVDNFTPSSENFSISINNSHVPDEDTQYWECAEVIIFNKELEVGEIKIIQSYLYHKYFDENNAELTEESGMGSGQTIFNKDNPFLFPPINSQSPLYGQGTDFMFNNKGDTTDDSVFYRKIVGGGVNPESNRKRLGLLKLKLDNMDASKLYDQTVDPTSNITTKFVKTSSSKVCSNTVTGSGNLYSLDDKGQIHICKI